MHFLCIEPKIIYKLRTFEKLGLKIIIKTTEESASIDNSEIIKKLLNQSDINIYRRDYNFIHIGLVHVAFKPLTLQGLPESFIAMLRDAENINFKQSLMGIVQSSMAHGPVYFNIYPNLNLSLTDDNILDALTLYVKTNGYNYLTGSEVICICHRIYFKPLHTLNPMCRIFNNEEETILIETNFNKSKISTRRPIKWEEIEFPDSWIIEEGINKQPMIDTKPTSIIQTSEGSVEIQFENMRSISSKWPHAGSRSSFSPLDYNVDYPQSSRASSSRIRDSEENINNKDEIIRQLKITKNNIAHHDDPTLSKISFNGI